MEKHDLIKHDKNFMEYPLWFIAYKEAEKKEEGYIWKNKEGYTYRSSYKPPSKTDIIFLFCLLLRSQESSWENNITITRAEILRKSGFAKNKKNYDRIEESLRRWKRTTIEFSGIFFNGKDYKTLEFSIINDFGIHKKTKKIEIEFNKKWLLQQKSSKYFKLLDFEDFKKLHDPLSTRLYEILIKQFYNRSEWKIDSLKLALKIPMAERYPAHIIPKIKTAISRISSKTTLSLDLHVERKKGVALLTFRKINKSKYLFSNDIMNLIPQKFREKSLSICNKIYVEKGEDCLKFYIGEVNKVFKLKGDELKNYGGYLRTLYSLNKWEELEGERKREEERIASEFDRIQLNIKETKEIDSEKIKQNKRDENLAFLINSLTKEQDDELSEYVDQYLMNKAGKYDKERYFRYKMLGKKLLLENLTMRFKKKFILDFLEGTLSL